MCRGAGLYCGGGGGPHGSQGTSTDDVCRESVAEIQQDDEIIVLMQLPTEEDQYLVRLFESLHTRTL